ncbi:peptidoglycan/xylan/chitin deacetylase (PgdA/CDA1 family) [Bacillus oleivorans]|uniref:Peptidoglycan/xylan/chitin deacetylase (PgdA/CDA1 family) n=1 Tax=Bacillus oleivorans TaxID=1448271 RepID=A0A285CIJ1_9BACI|nr:polysaccharide deacetylase family protein [Bacillus oleivorans]SNX66803.1 peptidoglycan/xylan/chitin deacetylase (PgdA/CDA1 family) [Bacillus oleivorans]
MSVYSVKLLELLSVEENGEKSFLQVRLLFQSSNQFLWEIDRDTAANIQKIVDFQGSFKYRMSFQTSWDNHRNQYLSFLTRTFRDQSDRIYFPCSEEFAKGLDTLRKMEQISEIDTFPFLLREQTAHAEEEGVETELFSRPKSHRVSWMAAAMVAFLSISAFLLVYLKDSFRNDTPFSHPAIVEAKTIGEQDYNGSLNEQTDIASLIKPENKPSDTPISDVNESSSESLTAEEPSIPLIEVEERLTYSIPEGSVALTFDDGPSKYSKEIIDILKKYEVGGTFFFIGLHAKKYPEYVQYVHDNGYSIGSHTMNHTNMTNLSYEEQEKEMIQSIHLIEDIIQEEVVLFRPPYGAKNETTLELAERTNHKLVLWNKDTEDWKHHNSEEIFQYVANSDTSGAIILLHESQAVIDALPRIIEYLQQQGLEVVGLR